MTDEEIKLVWPGICYAADHYVGKHRTNAKDIARILWLNGAQSSLVFNAVEEHIQKTLPVCQLDEPTITSLQNFEKDLAERGYSQAELRHKMAKGSRLSGSFRELAVINQELRRLYKPLDEAFTLFQAKVAAWWRDNEAAIKQICQEVANQMVAGTWQKTS